MPAKIDTRPTAIAYKRKQVIFETIISSNQITPDQRKGLYGRFRIAIRFDFPISLDLIELSFLTGLQNLGRPSSK